MLSSCVIFVFQTYTFQMSWYLEHLLCACTIPSALYEKALLVLSTFLQGRGRVRNKYKTKQVNECHMQVVLSSLYVPDDKAEIQKN